MEANQLKKQLEALAAALKACERAEEAIHDGDFSDDDEGMQRHIHAARAQISEAYYELSSAAWRVRVALYGEAA